MNTNNKRKIIYKCSNPYCSFEDFLPVDAVILCQDGPHKMKEVRMGDTCFICNEGTLIGDESDKELDLSSYETLSTYPPQMIKEAVKKLRERFSDMSEEQCLLNLEMDLAERDQLARGR